MADFTLEAQPRDVTGKKVKRIRNKGMVPAVVYGPATAPSSIQIPYRPLEVTLMQAGGTNLIDISVEGQKHTVLTRDVQRHILRGDILHVDFFALDMNQPITADVFIRYSGESPAVENGEGIMITGPSSLSIETLPTKLISEVEVDISSLVHVGDSIHVRDLDLGEDVTVHNDPEELLARIVVPSAIRALEEEEAEAEALEGEEETGEVERVGDDEEEDFEE